MKRKVQIIYHKYAGLLRRLFCGVMVSAMVCTQTVPVFATSKAEKEKQEAQKKLNEANKKAQEAEHNKSAAQNQVSKLTKDLTALLSDIKILENDMANKEKEIKQAESDYQEAKKEEEKQYIAMKKRIQYMYEKGDTQYLDIFLQVKDMSDLLNKAEYVEDIYTYDRKMLVKFQETKQQVADYKSDLEEDKNEMEVMELEYKDQKKQLETLIATKKKEVSNFDSQLATAKKDADLYAQTVAKKNEEIRKAKEEEARKIAEQARKKAEEDARKKAASNKGGRSSSKTNKYSGPNASKSSGGTVQGRAVADYGLQFVGNPYVFGGTSLTNGTDCSGFVQSVYRHFGYSLPRSSSEQRSAGTEVSYSDAQPGDLICYAGHIGIYIGNGQIVHASSPATGIKVGTATYRTILSVRRVIQ
ncbi:MULTISPECIES: C40 family peptidase [Lacrimispora]|uniref:C40 family peptidase n=1 Tax=Lacrimispora TaxID=2719231 RepID=UPI000BE27E2F|nr:C40 family peptidase [Lacrimispora amygdalina]MDK2968634.1 peptidoglycan DL-endopeptidase CwlO [Lacrimispora sp.]